MLRWGLLEVSALGSPGPDDMVHAKIESSLLARTFAMARGCKASQSDTKAGL